MSQAKKCEEDGLNRIAVALFQGASLLSVGSIIAPLDFVKNATKTRSIELSVFALGDTAMASTVDVFLTATLGIEDLRDSLAGPKRPDVVFVCCGQDVPEEHRHALRWLMRDCRRNDVRVIGIGAAIWVMAEMGWLPTGHGVVHWSSLSAFSERYQNVAASEFLFVSDEKVTSCAGELATLDLVLDFIGAEFGNGVLQNVCDHFLVSFPRASSTLQPGAAENRLRHVLPIVRSMVKTMRESLDQNIKMSTIAEMHGISQRQMERLFQKHLGSSPVRFITQMRAEVALQLVEQTELSLLDIAIACGFNSHGLMSRRFRQLYGISPRELRQKLAKKVKGSEA